MAAAALEPRDGVEARVGVAGCATTRSASARTPPTPRYRPSRQQVGQLAAQLREPRSSPADSRLIGRVRGMGPLGRPGLPVSSTSSISLSGGWPGGGVGKVGFESSAVGMVLPLQGKLRAVCWKIHAIRTAKRGRGRPASRPKLAPAVDLGELRRPQRVQGLRHAGMASRRWGSEAGTTGWGSWKSAGAAGTARRSIHRNAPRPLPNEHRCACAGRPR